MPRVSRAEAGRAPSAPWVLTSTSTPIQPRSIASYFGLSLSTRCPPAPPLLTCPAFAPSPYAYPLGRSDRCASAGSRWPLSSSMGTESLGDQIASLFGGRSHFAILLSGIRPSAVERYLNGDRRARLATRPRGFDGKGRGQHCAGPCPVASPAPRSNAAPAFSIAALAIVNRSCDGRGIRR